MPSVAASRRSRPIRTSGATGATSSRRTAPSPPSILRVKEGNLPRPFKVPIGTAAFIAMCTPPLLIVFAAFFINGTDYFVGGMTALVSGPIMYFVFKRRYGGLTASDPAAHPVNPKTGLAIGDTRRLTWMLAAMTVIGVIAFLFLPWYEDPDYYTQEYGIEGLFDFLMAVIGWMTIACGAVTVIVGVLARRLEPGSP